MLEEKIRILRAGWLAEADEAVVDQVARASLIETLAPDTLLHARGDEAKGYYCVLSGRIKISVLDSEGREVTLTVLEEGAWFGEISLLDGLPRTHDAYALQASRIFMTPKAVFQRTIEQHPCALLAVSRSLCRRIRLAFIAVEESTLLPLPERLARKLLYLDAVFGQGDEPQRTLVMKISQQEIAQMLGVSRQSVSKLMTEWAASGLIAIEYSSFRISNRSQLQRLAGATLAM